MDFLIRKLLRWIGSEWSNIHVENRKSQGNVVSAVYFVCCDILQAVFVNASGYGKLKTDYDMALRSRGRNTGSGSESSSNSNSTEITQEEERHI